ncbi:MAG: ABC transporter ATP-binding protein, partial [Clostridia bacterium]|nr:ABC transporter ATP-binding protein [Clostridia bacterium]
MLQLKNIVKTYEMGDTTQTALKGVSVSFRESEFVSILGQSGSGKTTLLNIIGGLDRYTDGDLIINGVSTKQYTDADWDAYRNHSIGFIFQSYNLIPHQTVLSNVEMALTLSGVSKKERKERAVAVLEKVGLSDHIHKRPNQMSGGQMQRVAIARALINNPDILLADEPTGALDSETSLQIMDLLKEIAKDKLVVMVTHNPELAEKYSTRIVNLLDGQIISDTDPFEPTENSVISNTEKSKKVSMSFLTALSLSFNNLRTKKARTILTAFAGSIGIIGIALILSLSTGMSTYIDEIQKNTMESYPITIGTESFDMFSLGGNNMGDAMKEMEKREERKKRTAVYADYSSIKRNDAFTSSFKTNNLTDFKKYLDNPESEINKYLGENGVVYTYDIKFSAFSYNKDNKLIDSDVEIEDEDKSPNIFSGFSVFFPGSDESTATNFSQMLKGAGDEAISSIVTDNYDVIYGTW